MALLADLRSAFIGASVRQAQLSGNLLAGVTPDWSEPADAHLIFGDGTISKPFSDVVAFIHPVSGKKVHSGSRATRRAARVQVTHREKGADEKPERGINVVSMHTRTEWGRVVLGVDTELRAEAWTALDLIEQIATAAGDGVHSVVYDGAITGWHVAYLLATYRIQVFGNPAARDPDADSIELKKRIEAQLARLAVKYPHATFAEPRMRRDLLADLMRSGEPLPVGTSIYPSEKGFTPVHGVYHLVEAVHTAPTGEPCVHDLAMDDGALYAVAPDPVTEVLVKTAHLPCTASSPTRTRSSRWARVNHYRVECARHGAFDHQITWEPEGTRYTRTNPKKKTGTPEDPIASRLHPISRVDHDKHPQVKRARNDAEAYQSWFKRTMSGKNRERASALMHEGQLLDALMTGVVVNSDTYWRRRRAVRPSIAV